MGRHWRFFGVITLAAFLLPAAVYAALPGPLGTNIAAYGVTPLITTLANIRCALDVREVELPLREVLAWALSRAGSVILIDFVFYFAFSGGALLLFFPGNDGGSVLLGLLTVVFTSTLALADVYASIESQPNRLLTVPRAFTRSISLCWQNGNMWRVLALGAFLIAQFLLAVMLEQWFTYSKIPGAAFFADVPLSTALAAPFAVLFTVVYFDALAREKRLTL